MTLIGKSVYPIFPLRAAHLVLVCLGVGHGEQVQGHQDERRARRGVGRERNRRRTVDECLEKTQSYSVNKEVLRSIQYSNFIFNFKFDEKDTTRQIVLFSEDEKFCVDFY